MNLLQILKESINTIYVNYIGNDEIEKMPIYYIGGSQTLPPPLSQEEEETVLNSLAKGDELAKKTLVERNLRLVVYIAKKFENTGVGLEDLISIGTIGLMKAINTFNTDKKIKLATYASRCIENEILMCLRKNNKKKSEVSFDEPLNVDLDGNELLLSDVLGSDPNLVNQNIEKQVERDLLMHAVSNLSQREKTIMQLRFGLNQETEHTQKEVADTLGISQSYISRLEKRIMERLKKDLERVG